MHLRDGITSFYLVYIFASEQKCQFKTRGSEVVAKVARQTQYTLTHKTKYTRKQHHHVQ